MALISLGSVMHAHGVPPAEISLPGTLGFPDPPQDSHGRNDTSSSVMASGTSGSRFVGDREASRTDAVRQTSENELLLAPQAKILRSLSPDNVDF